MNWQREFFSLAGIVLACRQAQLDGAKDPVWHFLGEMDYGSEMYWVLKEAGMLPAQRLARCAAGLLNDTGFVRPTDVWFRRSISD